MKSIIYIFATFSVAFILYLNEFKFDQRLMNYLTSFLIAALVIWGYFFVKPSTMNMEKLKENKRYDGLTKEQASKKLKRAIFIAAGLLLSLKLLEYNII